MLLHVLHTGYICYIFTLCQHTVVRFMVRFVIPHNHLQLNMLDVSNHAVLT